MQSFDFNEILLKYRFYILAVLVGLVLVGAGILFFKKDLNFSGSKVEVLQSAGTGTGGGEITAEISGAVISPGVYKLPEGSRVNDLLVASGGFGAEADRVWTDKYLNRAAKLTDGQKVFIPPVDEQSEGASAKKEGLVQSASSGFSSDSTGMINVNTATPDQLDLLPGIGPVFAQKIIDHRPYSKTEDLVSSGAITQTIYEKIKNQVTVY